MGKSLSFPSKQLCQNLHFGDRFDLWSFKCVLRSVNVNINSDVTAGVKKQAVSKQKVYSLVDVKKGGILINIMRNAIIKKDFRGVIIEWLKRHRDFNTSQTLDARTVSLAIYLDAFVVSVVNNMSWCRFTWSLPNLNLTSEFRHVQGIWPQRGHFENVFKFFLRWYRGYNFLGRKDFGYTRLHIYLLFWVILK